MLVLKEKQILYGFRGNRKMMNKMKSKKKKLIKWKENLKKSKKLFIKKIKIKIKLKLKAKNGYFKKKIDKSDKEKKLKKIVNIQEEKGLLENSLNERKLKRKQSTTQFISQLINQSN